MSCELIGGWSQFLTGLLFLYTIVNIYQIMLYIVAIGLYPVDSHIL